MTEIKDVRFRIGFRKKTILQVAVNSIDKDLDPTVVWKDASMQDAIDAMRQGYVNPKDNDNKE